MSTIKHFECEKENSSELIEGKTIMRNKKLIVIVLILLIVSIVGNIILSFYIYKIKNRTESNEKTIRGNQSIVDEKTNNVSDDSGISSNDADKESEEMREISLNEQIIVNTSYGDFNLIIEHVKAIDWLEDRDEGDEFQAIVIECDIQNINYTDPYNDIFWLENYLNVLDETNYVVENLNFSESDGEYIGNAEIPVGANGKILTGYKVKNGVKKLNISVNEQYKLNVKIEF